MKFSLIALFVAGAIAVPTGHGGDGGSGGSGGGSYAACPGTLFGETQCCATDVLGVLGLDCTNPSEVPKSADHYQELCATAGKKPACCVLPALGQGVLCQTPDGVVA